MKHTVLAAMAIAATGMGALGVGAAVAAEDSAARNPAGELVSAIAERFNLNAADVQAVFDEHRDARKAEHAEHEAARLQDAVANGDITQAQAAAITAKREEMKSFMETLKDMTPAQRKAAMKAQFEELKQWLEDNGIPKQFAFFGRLHQRGPMPGGRFDVHFEEQE